VILTTKPWTPQEIQQRFERGPHQSSLDYCEFLAEEFVDFVQKGFWMVLPFELVKDLEGLRLSPSGVVPQRERRPRFIVDYSFYGINDDTLCLSIPGSMQFGKALPRLHQHIAYANPRFGPVWALKLDIGDGFYRVPLTTSGSLKLGVLLPPMPGLPPLVAFPLTLPMGWKEAPPFFCEFTETACDLTNRDLQRNARHPPHPLEDRASMGDFQPNPERGRDDHQVRQVPRSYKRKVYQRPLAKTDVFVDDFIGLGQDTPANPLVNQRRTLMHNVDKIFRPSDDQDPECRKQPISLKKLDKQDCSWQDIKRILGWDEAVRSKVLLLAPHRRERIVDELTEVRGRARVKLRRWESVLGQLRSLVDGIPGGEGQFSAMQDALVGHKSGRVRISNTVKAQIDTFLALLEDTNRPTTIEEIVPGDPVHEGAVDAAKAGMGGVWFLGEEERPVLWRAPFPKTVQDRLASFSKPNGPITNSDLELAGTVLHQAVLGVSPRLRGETVHTHCDNTPAVAWRERGSVTTTKCRADLLRLAALLRREQAINFRISHIAGVLNTMADDASRLQHLTDRELIDYFNSVYPQKVSWELYPPPKELLSAVISILSSNKSQEVSQESAHLPLKALGSYGANSVLASGSTQASVKSGTRSPTSFYSDSATGMDGLPLVASKSGLAQLRTPYVSWARRSPQWAPRIPG